MSEAARGLEQYYGAVQRRDMKAARAFLADDMVFVGLFETYPSADAYIATFTQLMQIVVRLDVKTIFGDEENAAIFMDMVTAGPVNATTLVAEWHEVRSGKIIRARSAFDGRPFAMLFT
jgi:SnoaL-like protein